MPEKSPLLDKEAALEFQDWVRRDPKGWMQDPKMGLGLKHWWEGMDKMTSAIPRAIEERKPIVIGSGHALSKDFTFSGCVPLWFLTAYGPTCKVAMTAPTDRQVKKVMWSELTARYNGSILKDNFGRLLICNLQLSEEWFVIAFTTKETGGAVGKFQGFHTPAICVIVSEGQAVADDIFDQIDGIMTSEIALLAVLGNPVRTTGRYVQMLKDVKNNIVLNLSCLDSPNVKEGREVIPGLCSSKWVEDKRKRWNKDGTGTDPRWQGRVLGKVPTTAIDSIIGEALYDKCVEKKLFESTRRGSIGVDPARFGDDDMVIKVKESGETVATIKIPSCDAVKGAGEVVKAQKKYFPEGQVAIVVDCDGLGGPYLDNIKHMIPEELGCVYVEFHGSSTDSEVVGEEYANLRAEAHFFQKEQMEDGKVSLPADDEIGKQEATETKYFINLRGKIQVESKDDLKEPGRLGRSPNDWDAEVLATWGMKYAPVIKPKDKWRERAGGSSLIRKTGSSMGA